MSGENSFKENLNWKKLSIDAVNTIIATAIGILLGLLVDKWRDNISKQENYQKVIVATINNLENYQKQIEDLKSWSDFAEETFEVLSSDDYQVTDSTLDEMANVFFVQDFMQQDRWIEENFISNGGFIEDTDLRLKIGNVYSIIDLAKYKFTKLRASSDRAYKKYLNYIVNDSDTKAIEKIWADNDFLNYYSLVLTTNSDIVSYLASIEQLNAEILKISQADTEALNQMRESSKKILETITKQRQ